jgi:hypothetical protein
LQAGNYKNKIWFLGRGFEEYQLMFDLKLENLKNCRVLDCNAGASAFTAHMHRQGFDVVAADILYGQDPQQMEQISEDDFKTLIDAHQGLEDRVDWNFFKNHQDMVQYRIKTYHDFSEDYKKESNNFYVKAELPKLPFLDNSFHLVLSSHLLFLYDDRLDYQFHLESIKEMLRVSSQEVRIFPLVKLRGQGEYSDHVEQIIKDLSSEYSVRIQKVNYHFRKGADEMMCIRKKGLGESHCGLFTYDALEVEGK